MKLKSTSPNWFPKNSSVPSSLSWVSLLHWPLTHFLLLRFPPCSSHLFFNHSSRPRPMSLSLKPLMQSVCEPLKDRAQLTLLAAAPSSAHFILQRAQHGGKEYCGFLLPFLPWDFIALMLLNARSWDLKRLKRLKTSVPQVSHWLGRSFWHLFSHVYFESSVFWFV